MPPPRAAYVRLPASTPASAHSDSDSDHEPEPRRGPSVTAVHVDASFRRWTAAVARRMRQKQKHERPHPVPARVEIMSSVFAVWDREDKGKAKETVPLTLDHGPPLELEAFQLVRAAIEQDVQPRLNAKGSSGSYFARDVDGATIGIFKPKDEEPYGKLNPKLLKWVHRNFLSSVIPFGRACLIPQLSYLSEAAASLLDRRLEANIVPRTEVVELSSSAFYYGWIDRERARSRDKGGKGIKLPPKPGSWQVFLKGYKDASLFLRDHPVPGRPLSQTLDADPKRRHRIDIFAFCDCLCGRAEAVEDEGDGANWGWGGEDDGKAGEMSRSRREARFEWTAELLLSFREQLEKLVVLDYLMRNTDRGLDNFMLRFCPASAVDGTAPHIHLAAIDNSLSFPHQHPGGWRSYTYGWLYLPVNLIGLPFSRATREHYLPLLSSPLWWAQTTLELRRLFELDPDFRESMFLKQLAVIKGQGYNLCESLRDEGDGPLELCRRSKKMVWDEIHEVPDDDVTRSLITAASLPPPARMPQTAPMPSPAVFPPEAPQLPPTPTSPMSLKRGSSDSRTSTRGRPISFSSVVSASHVPADEYGSVTGVSMLARLEAQERDGRRSFGHSGARLLADDEVSDEEHDEGGKSWGVRSDGDVRQSVSGERRSWNERVRETISFDMDRSQTAHPGNHPSSGRQVVMGRNRSGSLSNVAGRARGSKILHGRNASAVVGVSDMLEHGEGHDEDDPEAPRTKVVVVERLEIVEAHPVFAW